MTSVSRRQFIQTLGIGFGAVALGPLLRESQSTLAMPFQTTTEVVAAAGKMSFTPIKAALPFPTDGLTIESEKQALKSFTVADDVVLPEGFGYTVVTGWGDALGNGQRVGFNCDYTSFIPTDGGQGTEGLLSINHEYVDPIAWMGSYEQVIGPAPVIARAATAIVAKKKDEKFSPEELTFLAGESLRDMGVSVQKIRKNGSQWERVSDEFSRAVSGISGLGINKYGAKGYQGVTGDQDYLVASGPAVEVFMQGWDGLGNRIIGTNANCSGGDTPWGTVLSAEENFQSWVYEESLSNGQSRLPDGSWDISKAEAMLTAPDITKFVQLNEEDGVRGAGNVFMLQGNKYGWMVEIDPSRPTARAVKHTALGRFRHENITFRAEEGKPLVAYMGDDRRGGHTWKYVSKDVYRAAKGKANSALLTEGTLYAAKMNAPKKGEKTGTGRWIPLTLSTPVDPIALAYLTARSGKYDLQLPARKANGQKNDGGFFKPQTQAEINNFKARYKTLGDLYASQGAILIDAYWAANAAGATPGARPEDLEVHPVDKSVYIAYTDGRVGSDGSPDARVFATKEKDANGIAKAGVQPYGAVYRLVEDKDNLTAMTFSYSVFQSSGELGAGGAGWANVDNMVFDKNGNLWLVTDQSTTGHNKAVKDRKKDSINGVFGNNNLVFVPVSGPDAGKPFLFAFGPMESEMTGPTFTPDGQTLFLSVQHPGEVNGIRKGQKQDTRQFELLTRDGKSTFTQERIVPIGSNWPSKQDGKAPRPCVIAIQKTQGGIA